MIEYDFTIFTIAKCLKSVHIMNYSINDNSSTNPIWSVNEMGTVVSTGHDNPDLLHQNRPKRSEKALLKKKRMLDAH